MGKRNQSVVQRRRWAMRGYKDAVVPAVGLSVDVVSRGATKSDREGKVLLVERRVCFVICSKGLNI